MPRRAVCLEAESKQISVLVAQCFHGFRLHGARPEDPVEGGRLTRQPITCAGPLGVGELAELEAYVLLSALPGTEVDGVAGSGPEIA